MKRILSLIFLMVMCGSLNAQELEPLDLVKKVFTDTHYAKNTIDYSIGEYQGHPNANDLKQSNEKFDLNVRLLKKYENTAVVNMRISDDTANGVDIYAYLVKNKDWKITAIRSLAQTGFIRSSILGMERMNEQEILDYIKNNDSLNTKEDFYLELETFKLTVALDDTIIEHFHKNREKFEQLKDEIVKIKFDKDEASYREINLGKQIKTNYKKLLLHSISTSSYVEGGFEFIIGGILDNTVGYLYIPNKKDVPKMKASRIIMIREIGNGWYLFKTT